MLYVIQRYAMFVMMVFSAMRIAIPLMVDNTLQLYSVYNYFCYVFSMQILMNVRQAMETVPRHVPTHQDLESVAAAVDTDWLVMAEHAQVSFNCLHV